jgi:hypothetical protein
MWTDNTSGDNFGASVVTFAETPEASLLLPGDMCPGSNVIFEVA